MGINDNLTYKLGAVIHGAYRIERVLGQGSFGITYLATHLVLNKKVAVKEFFMKGLNSRGAGGLVTGMEEGSLPYNYGQKFKKEALNLAILDHPNIVRVTDSFKENGTYYYVMEYIEDENLNEYVENHHINELEAVEIIKSIADALIYMHEKHHMLHLDLKPGNVMRRISDGQVFLIDFGLSKHYRENGEPETSTSIGLGTLGYAPIEQENQSRNGEFRPTIDIYALGATLYKLLTRETPPVASELVSNDGLLESNLLSKGISQRIIDVVRTSMSPNITKRFQTVRDFKYALLKISEEEKTLIDGDERDGVNILTVNAERTSSSENKRSKSIFALVGVIGITMFIVLFFIGKNNKFTKTNNVANTDTIHIENYAVKIMGDNCVYTGSAILLDDSIYILSGTGEVKFNDGRYYKGPIRQGTLTGDNAVFNYSNGDTFRGSFENDHFSKGRYNVKKTGEYFIGLFDASGQPYKGTWYESNGNKIEVVNN